MTSMTVIGRYLGAVRNTTPERGRVDERPLEPDGYSLDLLEWDELNVEIDDLCAAFKEVQPNVLPIYPSTGPPQRVR
jgi:hypothetical protein